MSSLIHAHVTAESSGDVDGRVAVFTDDVERSRGLRHAESSPK